MNNAAKKEVSNIGHNKPPGDVLTERLTSDHHDLLKRAADLLAAVDRVPDVIETDESAGKVADFIKQLQACIKNAEATRVEEKEPYLEGSRRVDAFFKVQVGEPIAKAKAMVNQRLTVYQRKVAAEEKARREEEERLAREEANRLRREAEEKAAALREEHDLQSAITAEEEAKVAEAAAAKAEKIAAEKPADMSRSRGQFGSVASLKTVWSFTDLDRSNLDLEALRSHLPLSGLQQAVRSYVKAGGRELNGVKIFEDTVSTVR